MKLFKITILFIVFASFSFLSHGQSSLKKANKQYKLHAFNLAIQSYLKDIKKEKYTTESLCRLADSYRMINQLEHARKWYEKAVVMKDVQPEHILKYGKVLQSLGRYQEAGQWFQIYGAQDAQIGSQFESNCNFALRGKDALPAFDVEILGINTSSSEFGIATFEDKIIFASSRVLENKKNVRANWSGNAMNQVYYAESNLNGAFNDDALLHKKLKGTQNEGPLSYSPTEPLVAYTKNNFVDGTRQISDSGMELSIYIAEVQANGDWNNAKPFPHNGVGFSSGYPSFSPDGQALFLAANRPDGFGGYDIYVSYKAGNSWTAPENLGPTINTKGDEIAPFFDGKNLYFSSDYHPGFGGYDIFRSPKNGDKYEIIYNLGTVINTSYDDYGYIYSKRFKKGFFVSNRPGGRGNEDIYAATKVKKELSIVVRNAGDNQVIPEALIDFSNCDAGITQTNERGFVKQVFEKMAPCRFSVTKEGYITEHIDLDLENSNTNSIEIILKSIGETAQGKVVQRSDGQPLSEVIIKATNQQDGVTSTVKSGPNGDYTLSLKANTKYLLLYSKAGYLEINQYLNTTKQSKIINIPFVELMKIGEQPATTQGPSGVIVENVTIKGNGFAVQVASVSPSNSVGLKKIYDELSGIGNVYVIEEKGLKKIRVGVFSKKQDALNAQNELSKRGYKGTFVVKDSGPVFGEIDNNTIIVSPDLTKPEKIYKVRLGAFKSLKWFDETKLAGGGEIEYLDKNGFTIILLGRFNDLTEAKEGLGIAKKAGYKDALIVDDTAGELKPVK